MDFFDVIQKRKSVRSYLSRNVSPVALDKIVTAGNMAACAQTAKLQFTVITNPKLLEAFNSFGVNAILHSGIKSFVVAAEHPDYNVFDGATALIVVSAPQD